VSVSLSRLERQLGYTFKDQELMVLALTHRSFAGRNNERLEFLGDAILNAVVADGLYQVFPELPEGDLSRLRANLVCQEQLVSVAEDLGLSRYLRLGEGELKSGGQNRPSILADALEAIIGATYLDGGFAAAEAFVLGLYAGKLDTIDPKVIDKDPKSLLQELLQSRKIAVPEYTVTLTSGEAHAQRFVVECFIEKHNIRTVGEGSSRRIAEQQAAQLALLEFKKIHIGKTKK